MSRCRKCDKPLSGDEIGLHKKLWDKRDTTYLCLTCLAERLHCEPSLLQKKIRQFREQGCVLFPEI